MFTDLDRECTLKSQLRIVKKANIPALGCERRNVQRALKDVAYKTVSRMWSSYIFCNGKNKRPDHITSNFRDFS